MLVDKVGESDVLMAQLAGNVGFANLLVHHPYFSAKFICALRDGCVKTWELLGIGTRGRYVHALLNSKGILSGVEQSARF